MLWEAYDYLFYDNKQIIAFASFNLWNPDISQIRCVHVEHVSMSDTTTYDYTKLYNFSNYCRYQYVNIHIVFGVYVYVSALSLIYLPLSQMQSEILIVIWEWCAYNINVIY
jgi:hypothetical protein